MTQFRKYCPGAYVLETERDDYERGDLVNVTTRNGKNVEIRIWKRIFARNGVTYYSYVRSDGMSRNEWLLKKAARYANASAKNAQKSDQFYDKSRQDADFLSLGEPIKIGHHSERRHRSAIEKANNNMRKSVEAKAKAAEQAEKAESLAAKAETEIAIDVPESIELLEAKISNLKQERDALKASKSYQSFELTNIGANIRRYEARLKSAENLWKLEA